MLADSGERLSPSHADDGVTFGTGTLIMAWALTLAVSNLPDILCKALVGTTPTWLYPAKLGLLAVLIAAGLAQATFRPLRLYALFLLAVLGTEQLGATLERTPWWQGAFGGGGFAHQMLGTQLLRVGGAFVMIAALLLLRFRRAEFFLVKGDVNAPAQPVRWLGIDGSVRWKPLGLISALCISLGTLAFLVLGGRPTLSAVVGAATLLPMILLLAAMNAFGEEVTYRGALLAPTIRAVGPRHAVLLTAAFFGIGHYYGVPYGIVGVAMASLLGWFLGKAMVETKGFLWPWFIHFLQDVMIFYFLAMGAVVAGGR